MSSPRPLTISAVSSNFEREPLIRPFGFKGGYMSEIWQTVAMLQGASGRRGIGLCSQGVLWSDALPERDIGDRQGQCPVGAAVPRWVQEPELG